MCILLVALALCLLGARASLLHEALSFTISAVEDAQSAQVKCGLVPVAPARWGNTSRATYKCDDGTTAVYEDDAWVWSTSQGEMTLRLPTFAVAPFLIASSSPKGWQSKRIKEIAPFVGVFRLMNMGHRKDGFYVLRNVVVGKEDECGSSRQFKHSAWTMFAWTCSRAFEDEIFFSSSLADVGKTVTKAMFSCTPSSCSMGSPVPKKIRNARIVLGSLEHDAFEASIFSREEDWRSHAHPGTPTWTLLNGLVVPLIGLGTGGLSPQETTTSVKAALKAGYALIDSAAAYGNEQEIGKLVTTDGRALIITKIWPTELGFERSYKSAMESLRRLNVGAIDILLIHWPRCYSHIEWMDCSTADREPDQGPPLWHGTWRAMEKLYAEGHVLAIGLSNFDSDLLNEVHERAAHVDAMLVQNFLALDHVRAEWQTIDTAHALGIYYQAYATLREGLSEEDIHTIQGAMRRAGVSPRRTQERDFLLRWLMESNIGVIPRSSSPRRVVANIEGPLSIANNVGFDDIMLLVDPHDAQDSESADEGDYYDGDERGEL